MRAYQRLGTLFSPLAGGSPSKRGWGDIFVLILKWKSAPRDPPIPHFVGTSPHKWGEGINGR